MQQRKGISCLPQWEGSCKGEGLASSVAWSQKITVLSYVEGLATGDGCWLFRCGVLLIPAKKEWVWQLKKLKKKKWLLHVHVFATIW